MRSSRIYTETTRRRASGAIILCLLLSLTACGSNPPASSTRTERLLPPASLLVETFAPIRSVVVNGDLADLYLDTRDALKSCNDDKAAIRAWAIAK